MKLRVLWVAPNLNQYKLGFLEHLAAAEPIDIEVFSGGPLTHLGHVSDDRDSPLIIHRNQVSKLRFAFSPSVVFALVRLLKSKPFDLVLFPIEKKHLPLILLLAMLRPFRRFRLVSYNHACLRSRNRRVRWHDTVLTRLLFRIYDRIVFYSAAARQWALDKKLVRADRSGFANNTLNTKQIWNAYELKVNDAETFTILFIGRLVPSKRVGDVIDYYRRLNDRMQQDVRLTIIGDGPDAGIVQRASQDNDTIEWLGALADEERIREQMERSHVVFVPGSSGLSIVHAFCYGKPYITLAADEFSHGPEFNYLADGINGLVLCDQDIDHSLGRVADLLSDQPRYQAMCQRAYDTAQGLSIEKWSSQMAAELRTAVGL